jgi:hypothetical protein
LTPAVVTAAMVTSNHTLVTVSKSPMSCRGRCRTSSLRLPCLQSRSGGRSHEGCFNRFLPSHSRGTRSNSIQSTSHRQ